MLLGCVVKGLSQVLAKSEEETLNLFFEGELNRSVGNHALNQVSSRSHTIFTVFVESKNRIDGSDNVTFSKLNLVDLAGSERLAKTKSVGKTSLESRFINKSLTFLEQVIIALGDKKRDHIPFRQSHLTNVLRDALGKV
jgi:kinesin family protein 6/9